MAIIKKPYELSAWIENLEENGIKRESKGVTIGAHDMSYLGKATQVKLKRERKGTNTLTFQMPSKFFDSQLGEYVHNELSDYIANETKIKLLYKDKYYDFYVKKIDEKKTLKAIIYSYTCQDSFIDELSRTGYDITFDPELNNSVAEIGEFVEEILDDSSWEYKPEYNYGDFTEYNEQRFYKIPLKLFGGSIDAYKINLEVLAQDFLDNDNNPKEYLQKILEKENLLEDWKKYSITEKYEYIYNLIKIYDVESNKERIMQLGDDLARIREVFWDPYYKGNGSTLISEDNKVSLNGDYIYVPITDLSYIMGSIYKDAYKCVEEPALYGTYENGSQKYALQPTSKNPKDLIQILFLEQGDIYNIDEANVLTDLEYHYVIPVEEWHTIIGNNLKPTTEKDKGLIYWTSSISKSTLKNPIYEIVEEDEIAYTKNVNINSSTIDDFTWYPVYSEGYLDSINDNEISKAKKISVTNRTEYNKNSDIYVNVYNNKSKEYKTLLSEQELIDQVNKGEEYRVCSKLNTRQILPELARNLVENGKMITDTVAWESRIQNLNNDDEIGFGSSIDLMTIEAKSDVAASVTEVGDGNFISKSIEQYNIDGSINDEAVSDYYLQLKSQVVNNMGDFSSEGNVYTDYAINFGIISQEKKIEKDQVYAIKITTGNYINNEITVKPRSISKSDIKFSNQDKVNLVDSVEDYYKKIFYKYKEEIDNFSDKSKTQGDYEIFNKLISIWPKEDDPVAEEKLSQANRILRNLISVEETVFFWTPKNKEIEIVVDDEENEGKTKKQKKEIINWETKPISIEGIDTRVDKYMKDNYDQAEEFMKKGFNTSWLIKQPRVGMDSKIDYNNSDVIYLKTILYQKLKEKKKTLFPSFFPEILSNLTSIEIDKQMQSSIIYIKELNKEINNDLDKIIIGKGSIDLNGNYYIEGTENKQNEQEYISFKEIFEVLGEKKMKFIPSLKDGDLKQRYHYYTEEKSGKKQWKWKNSLSNDNDNAIEDDTYLLFKAKQTINNPYIAIRVDSKPLKLNFDYIRKIVYKEYADNGVTINVKKNGSYYDNIGVQLTPINSFTCTDEFLELIDYDLKYGTFDEKKAKEIVWDDEKYLKSTNNSQYEQTSVKNTPIYKTFTRGKTINDDNKEEYLDRTYPYLLFLNHKYQGIIYLKKKTINGDE